MLCRTPSLTNRLMLKVHLFSPVKARLRATLQPTLDFTSARKRMSVILRRIDSGGGEDGKVYLLAKGADNVIIERLSAGQEEAVQETEDHLAEFASEGLRTLTLAYKAIPGEYFVLCFVIGGAHGWG